MKPHSYFILRSSEDGISITGPITAAQLLDRVREHQRDYDKPPRFYDRMPEMDKGCFCERAGEEGLLVIRGEIVVPEPKTTVTDWSLPSGCAGGNDG